MARVKPDVVIEATGVPALVFGAMTGTSPYGITVLTGVSSRAHPPGRRRRAEPRHRPREQRGRVVGEREPRHYEQAADALAKADPDWLGQLVSRRVPLADHADAFEPQEDDVKVVLTLD